MKGWIGKIVQNHFLRNSMVLFLGTMIVNILNYIFHLLVGRMVTPEAYGEIESLISLLVIISVPAGTLTLIATKYAAQMKAKQDNQGTAILSRYFNQKILIYGVPLFLLALLFTPFVRDFLGIKSSLPVLFLWVVMAFSFLSAITIGLLTGWQRFSDINVISVSSTALKLVSVALLIQFGLSVNGVWGGLVLAALCGYLLSLFFLGKLIKGHATLVSTETMMAPSTPSLKKYILPVFYGTLSMAILGNADMIFAKHHLDPSVSGEYGALSIVAKTIFFLTGVLTTVLFAMSAEGDRQSRKTVRTFHVAFWLTVCISFCSVVLFSLFPQVVMSLFFGEKYLAVSHLLGWFALAAGVYSVANLFMQYLLSLHETRVTLFLLALASLEIGALFFFGEGLYAIISITISAQVVAVLLGGVFVVSQKKYA